MIVGIVYLFLSLEIKGYLPIDIPNTFYANVQEKLNGFQEYSFVNCLQKYKLWLNLIFGLLIILVPFLLANRNRIKLAQKRFNRLLVFIAILTNITFFSGIIAKDSNEVENKLTELKINIEKVHNRIYSKIAGSTTFENFESFDSELAAYETLYEEFDERIEKESQKIIDRRLQNDFKNELQKLTDSIEVNKVNYNSISLILTSANYLEKEFNSFQDYGRKQSGINEKVNYFFNEEQWTYKNGVDFENKVDDYVEELKQKVKEKNSSKKVLFILEEIYTAISSQGIGVISELLPDIRNDLVKTLLKAISKATRDDILKSFVAVFDKSKIKKQKSIVNEKKQRNRLIKKYNSIVNSHVKKEQNLDKQIRESEKRVTRNIENELVSQIEENIKNIDFQKIEFQILNRNGKHVSIRNIEEYNALKNSELTNKIVLREKIITEYKNSPKFKNLFGVPISNLGNKREYLQRLKNINSSKVLKLNNVFNKVIDVLEKKPIICPCCFQNIQAVNVCVPINPICY
ncbi:hypothetical protein [Ascidiimonas sp. W6]|uniref:hypothetical protein n=1 Tax=Ascidiimonas meishanensis TaxID=3128903 RepID=UPI0030ECE927